VKNIIDVNVPQYRPGKNRFIKPLLDFQIKNATNQWRKSKVTISQFQMVTLVTLWRVRDGKFGDIDANFVSSWSNYPPSTIHRF